MIQEAQGLERNHLALKAIRKARYFPGGGVVKFKQPYYIPPHAVQRFRERVVNLPTRTIRIIIQSALQGCGQLVGYQVYDRQKCPVYKAQYRDKEVFNSGKD